MTNILQTDDKGPSIQKLDMVKAHKLAALMLDPVKGFTAKGLSVPYYVGFATEELGFQVTTNQVHTRIKEFGIVRPTPEPTPNEAALAQMVLVHEKTINDLNERLTKLEGWVNTTFPNRSPLKAVL